MQTHRHEPEDMLYPNPDFGFLSVVLFLCIRQRSVAVSFFVHAGFHRLRQLRLKLCPRICAVGVQNLVFSVHEFQEQRLAVMDIGAGHGIARYELAFRISFHMVLIPVMGLVAFLCSAGIGVLLAQLAGVLFFFPFPGDFPGLDAGVLLTGVSLARGIHEGCIHDGAGAGYEVRGFHLPGKDVEELAHNICFYEVVPEKPDGLGVRNTVFCVEPKEPHEAPAVVDLKFGLVVAQVVDALQNENLEHEKAVVGRTPACAFEFFPKRFFEYGTEDFPLNDAVEADKEIPQLAKLFQAVFFVKESHLHSASLHVFDVAIMPCQHRNGVEFLEVPFRVYSSHRQGC